MKVPKICNKYEIDTHIIAMDKDIVTLRSIKYIITKQVRIINNNLVNIIPSYLQNIDMNTNTRFVNISNANFTFLRSILRNLMKK